MFGTAGRLGGTFPGPGISPGIALATETVLSFGLMTVILGTSSGARNVGHNAAIAIGGYVVLAGLWASPVSGASMNPARSLGPALVSGDLGVIWIYLARPGSRRAARGRACLGAARASLARSGPGGPGGSRGSHPACCLCRPG